MIRNLLIGAAAAALAAGTAFADPTVTATWTGVVTSGTDDLGLFGDAGLDLTNVTFTAVYVLNPTAGYYQSASDFFDGEGGLAFTGGPSPVVSVQFTINGHTYSSDGSFAGIVYAGIHEGTGNNEYPAEFQTSGAGLTDNAFMAVTNDIYEYADRGYGNPAFANFDEDVSTSSSCDCYNNFQYGTFDSDFGDYLTLTNTHLKIQNDGFVTPAPSPEPEPVSWALMVGGFGLVGGALRVRRSATIRFA